MFFKLLLELALAKINDDRNGVIEDEDHEKELGLIILTHNLQCLTR